MKVVLRAVRKLSQTLTRSSNGTTNGNSIRVMSLRTSVLDSRGASSSTVSNKLHSTTTSIQKYFTAYSTQRL